jgi:hypothetical protein
MSQIGFMPDEKQKIINAAEEALRLKENKSLPEYEEEADRIYCTFPLTGYLPFKPLVKRIADFTGWVWSEERNEWRATDAKKERMPWKKRKFYATGKMVYEVKDVLFNWREGCFDILWKRSFENRPETADLVDSKCKFKRALFVVRNLPTSYVGYYSLKNQEVPSSMSDDL